MAIEFMIIAAPRSGTTWAANWLTTDSTLCLHDPLAYRHHTEWDLMASGKMMGVSDTGVSVFHQWLNAHPARKVILHRDRGEIAKSLGIPEFLDTPDDLPNVNGMHVHYTELFDAPKKIYEFLLQREFDQGRHEELRKIRMQPTSESMTLDKDLVVRLIREMKGLSHA